MLYMHTGLDKTSLLLLFTLLVVFLLHHISARARMNSLKRIAGDSLGGKGVTYLPTSGAARNVVIWMHGLGDTADGWASLMPSLNLPDTKFILPTAKTRPISLNGGMPMPGWSDIYGLDPSSKEDSSGFSESVERINQIIKKEVTAGIDTKRIVIAGFSQGGAVALQTALRSEFTLGGCVALSTWLPLRDNYPKALSSSSSSLKVLQIHGSSDQVVHHKWGLMSHETLKGLLPSAQVSFHTISGMGHSSDPEEINIVQSFLANVFT